MNFFVARDLIEDVQRVLQCDKNLAMKELLRQSRRLFALYSQSPVKHARYWSKVDCAALYALAHNRQLSKPVLDIALNDLESAERIVHSLDALSQQVYDDFVYFIEKITRPANNKDELQERVLAFVETYTSTQVATLAKFVRLADKSDLHRSLRDALQRVRSSLSTRIKGVYKDRVDLVLSFLDEVVETREQEDPHPVPPSAK